MVFYGFETLKQKIMSKEKDLNYWKENAEEDYKQVPISVLRYIAELETAVKNCSIPDVSKRFTIEEVKKMFFDAIQIGNGNREDTHYPDVDADIAEREWKDYIKENNVC